MTSHRDLVFEIVEGHANVEQLYWLERSAGAFGGRADRAEASARILSSKSLRTPAKGCYCVSIRARKIGRSRDPGGPEIFGRRSAAFVVPNRPADSRRYADGS
jgi:hypothetical protein